jgi:selenocysteine lyase/cysteine desulfurase
MVVHAAIEGKRYFDEMLLHGDACWDEWLARTENVRAKLAVFIGARPEEIAFLPNTSTGMGIIAQMLKGKGSVLTMDDEFPSTTFPWLNLGYQVDFVSPEGGTYPLERIESAIRPDHGILVTSLVQYKTGFRQQVRELGLLCKRNGLILVVNATQALGVFPIDVAADGVDFLVFSGLKWACAGYGTGALYMKSDFLILPMPMAGWRSVDFPERMDNRRLQLKREASVLEAGCPSFPAIFALGGALDLLADIGKEACMNRVLYLSRQLEQWLINDNFPVIPVLKETCRSGIVMMKTAGASLLVMELAKRNILLSARGEGLRISVHIFNNEEDLEKLMNALRELRNLV